MGDSMLSWRQRASVWTRLGIRFGVMLVVLLFFRRYGRGLLELTMPFILGWVMAIFLNPLVCWIEKRVGASRKTVSLLVVLILLGLVGGAITLAVYYAGREMMDLIKNWHVLFDAFQRMLESVELMLARLFALASPEMTATLDIAIDEILIWMEGAIPGALASLGETATNKFMGVPSFFVAAVMFMMGTYFITADYPAICKTAAKNVGAGISGFLAQIRTTALVAFGGYLKAQLLLSCGVFCILLLGFLVTGQQYAMLLALGLAVLDFIPLLGAGTVMVPWAILALVSKSFTKAIAIMVIWGIIAVYRRVAEPKIVGDQTGLSPILSLFSIYIGMKLGGVAGMILGPILLLVVLNLVHSGVFHGIFRDIRMALRDLAAVLSSGDTN